MSINTPLEMRNLNIYTIFVRNFTAAGTFNAIHSDLDRIKYLGTDIICFMPFYPIGEVNKKGSIGSPYAVKDHRAIEPSLGSLEEFEILVREIRKRNMKVMIDIVFHHTSPDSVLVEEHPDWFYKNADGSLRNQVGDWYDIVDLDYSNKELWYYQIDTLKYWARLVDGFRCDSAPLVPIEFWLKARKEIDKIKPNTIWVADSIEKSILQYLRSLHVVAHSDSEIYQAFDIVYEYDIQKEFHDYIFDHIPLSRYVYALNYQETNYPSNYCKIRFLENFDQDRIATTVFNIEQLIQWTAFNYLQKGATLLYNGQEVASHQTISLFEHDPIRWQTRIDLSGYVSHLSYVKKEYVPVVNVHYRLEANDEMDTVVMYYQDAVQKRVGVFNFKHHEGTVPVDVPDGEYTNLINDQTIVVFEGKIDIEDTPAFFIAT